MTPQVMQRTESHLRSTIVSRLTGANIDGRVIEARRLLLEKSEKVAALRQLIAVTEAAIFAGCAAGAGRLDASEYKTCLAEAHWAGLYHAHAGFHGCQHCARHYYGQRHVSFRFPAGDGLLRGSVPENLNRD